MGIESDERPVVRVIIADKNNNVLLGKRAARTGEGYYALIGGKPDPGETFEHAAKRETYEETKLRLRHVTYWKDKVETQFVPDKKFHGYIYISRNNGMGKPDRRENSELVRVSRRNLYDYKIIPSHQEALEEYLGLR